MTSANSNGWEPVFISLVCKFAQALRDGQDLTGLSEILNIWYYSRIQAALESFAKLNENSGGRLESVLNGCSRNALSELIRAPSTAALAYWLPGSTFAEGRIERLIQAAEVEQAREQPGVAHGWSALGDLWLKPDGTVWNAPRAGRFVVDTASPHRLEAPGSTHLASCDPETPEFAECALRKVKAAVAFLLERVPHAHALSQSQIRSIVPVPQEYFASSSNVGYPGRMVLKLPRDKSLNIAVVAAGIFHEAIHSFLYKIEAFLPFVRDADLRAQTIMSAWSGRMIPVPAYVHACFVWYGLSWFWAGMNRELLDQEGTPWRDQLVVAVRGFRNGAIERLEPLAGGLNEQVIAICRDLQAQIATSGFSTV